MKNIKKLLLKFISVVVGLYFMSIGVMSCYYCYKDIKQHNGFIRYVFWSPVVGAFKATHWPYYVFFEKKESPSLPPNSIISLQRSIYYLNSARRLIESISTSKNISADMEHILELLSQSQKKAECIDVKELNILKAGMGDAVKTIMLML
jgi:hypothetical protein